MKIINIIYLFYTDRSKSFDELLAESRARTHQMKKIRDEHKIKINQEKYKGGKCGSPYMGMFIIIVMYYKLTQTK